MEVWRRLHLNNPDFHHRILAAWLCQMLICDEVEGCKTRLQNSGVNRKILDFSDSNSDDDCVHCGPSPRSTHDGQTLHSKQNIQRRSG